MRVTPGSCETAETRLSRQHRSISRKLAPGFSIYNRIYAEYFAGPAKPNPTRTTIKVTALPTPIAIELKVIAAAG
jgi:enamine deaminase RidA (YjgF/YER057c/UK114 family)